jgi:hypothetical protein
MEHFMHETERSSFKNSGHDPQSIHTDRQSRPSKTQIHS